MHQIAIVIVGFNRLQSISRLLDSVSNAYYDSFNIPLVISIDKSDTDIIEQYADKFIWNYGEKTVIKHRERMGLRAHILSLGQLFDKYDALIILEDDLTVSPNFYTYAQQTVNKYFNDNNIAGISLFNFGVNYQTGGVFVPIKDENDVYFMNCAQSWGEIWMKNQWLQFWEWYNDHEVFPKESNILPRQICGWRDSSWLKYHTRYCIENNLYFVYPYISFATNNGDTGFHNKGKYCNINQERLQMGKITHLHLPDFIANTVVCYDGFFENKNLTQYLGINSDECCIDLNGEKGNKTQKKYWLTMSPHNYKIIRQFGVRYRPIEQNIITATEGNDIFLYNTNVIERNTFKKRHFSRELYDIRQNEITSIVRKYGIKNLIIEVMLKIAYKLFKVKK